MGYRHFASVCGKAEIWTHETSNTCGKVQIWVKEPSCICGKEEKRS